MYIYRGLSGLDSALFAFYAMDFLRANLQPRRTPAVVSAVLALLAFVGKIVYEYCCSAAFFVDTNQSFVVVPLAHLIGGVTGIVIAMRGKLTLS
jgi:uncharacterized membrane protein